MSPIHSSPTGSVHAAELENPFLRAGPRSGPTRRPGVENAPGHNNNLAQLEAQRRRANKGALRRRRQRDAEEQKLQALERVKDAFCPLLQAQTAAIYRLADGGRRKENKRERRRVMMTAVALVAVVAALVAHIEAGGEEYEAGEQVQGALSALEDTEGSDGGDRVADRVRRVLNFST